MTAPAQHECTFCHKKRPGRFTRRVGSAGGGWSQGLNLPFWACWTCLPEGQGRGESSPATEPKTTPTGGMTVAKKTQPEPVTSPLQLGKSTAVVELGKIQHELPSLQTEVAELSISNDEELAYADGLLGRISTIRKSWGLIWGRIQEKSIKPIRAGLEELYQLNRDADGPLAALEAKVKGIQTSYERAKLQRQADEDRKAKEEEARLTQEAERKQQAAAVAPTPQMAGRLTAAAERLMQQAVTVTTAVEESRATAYVPLLHSSTRKTRKVRVKAWSDVLQGVIDGKIPCDVIPWEELNATLNKMWKLEPARVNQWPGVEEYDDIQVTRK